MEIVPRSAARNLARPAQRRAGCSVPSCAWLICTVHDDPVPVRYAAKYAANRDYVCTPCGEMLYEQGELARIRGGYQYTYRC